MGFHAHSRIERHDCFLAGILNRELILAEVLIIKNSHNNKKNEALEHMSSGQFQSLGGPEVMTTDVRSN